MFLVDKRATGEYDIRLNVRTKTTIPVTLLEKYNDEQMVVNSIECHLRHRLYERLGLHQFRNELIKSRESIEKSGDFKSTDEWAKLWQNIENYFDNFLMVDKQ